MGQNFKRRWKLIENIYIYLIGELPRWHRDKESACQYRRCKRPRFDPWVRKIPWKRKWQPISVFLPEKFHDRGAWQTTVHGAAKNWTQLSVCEHTHTHTHTHLVGISKKEKKIIEENPPRMDKGWEDYYQSKMLA